ncbi:UDP-N-acetylenolpyruvoylglucosamine reductase [uncultured Ruminococcus sp.]|nr:UDP-N-acetylenolpyruvoylglucosamine reductase [uncultured Ruminococcus sp.]SCH71350.1 UDP-N-acetylenolpyruvoylglucosamine reductase [uncultured Clostridium sp.]
MMKETLAMLLKQQNIEYKENISLSQYTSFKIGGPCPLMLLPHTVQEVEQAVVSCKQENVPYLILGNGSNMLVSDDGYDGAVIWFHHNFSEIYLENETTVYAQAGVSLAGLCVFAQKHGLSGLEFAYGIPATVGGAVYMNAGAYGGEMKDAVSYADYVDETGKLCRKYLTELDFSYRYSFFTNTANVIVGAGFSLRPEEPEKIRTAMDDFYTRRKSKQPLEYPSAGSTFKRPQGAYAAQLIEDCGLKGRTVGGAQVSEKHSGFVINRGGATCADVLELIHIIQETVKEKTGFTLECEVKRIGF